MAASTFERLHRALMRANRQRIVKLKTYIWTKAWPAGLLTDDEAQQLALLADARGKEPVEVAKRTSVGSRPRTPASVPRRHRWVAEGWMPGELLDGFRWAEHAALSVIAKEWAEKGVCHLFLEAIAAAAGTCKTMVRAAIRKAADLGLLSSVERPRTAWRNDSNEVRIVHPAWRRWLRRRPGLKARRKGAQDRAAREAMHRAKDQRRAVKTLRGEAKAASEQAAAAGRAARHAAEGGGGSTVARCTTESFLRKESSVATRRSKVENCPSGSSISGDWRFAPRTSPG